MLDSGHAHRNAHTSLCLLREVNWMCLNCRVEHATDPGYPAYLPADHGKIATVAQAALTAAQDHLEKLASTVSMTDATLHAKVSTHI